VGIYNGVNNGWLGMSARSLASAINVSRATAARALKELTDRGFMSRLDVALSRARSDWHRNGG
jgi:predicted transcriptional regulator